MVMEGCRMKAKFLNQTFREGKKCDLWTTIYITDIPIKEPTAIVLKKVNDFVTRQKMRPCMGNSGEIRLQRDGMLGFWQFIIVTEKELDYTDIIEETEE